MIDDETSTQLVVTSPYNSKPLAKAKAEFATPTPGGSFFMPWNLDQAYQGLGLTPEKLIIPREYHAVVQMCYDFYQRGGLVSRVIDRMVEFAVTELRNGQRKTSDEQNTYFEAVLHAKPSRLMR